MQILHKRKDARIALAIPTEMREDLYRESAQTGLTTSAIVRIALAEYLQKEQVKALEKDK